MRQRGIDPPWWWRPWLIAWFKIEAWWHGERPVKLDGK